MVQWYVNVPTVLNVCENDWFGLRTPLSQAPVSLVVVCCVLPRLNQYMRVPWYIVMGSGWNAYSTIPTGNGSAIGGHVGVAIGVTVPSGGLLVSVSVPANTRPAVNPVPASSKIRSTASPRTCKPRRARGRPLSPSAVTAIALPSFWGNQGYIKGATPLQIIVGLFISDYTTNRQFRFIIWASFIPSRPDPILSGREGMAHAIILQ